jgi:hypothetical protein
MFRIPKALKEINKIQEKLSKTRKITDKDFVEKTRRSVASIKQKHAVRVVA